MNTKIITGYAAKYGAVQTELDMLRVEIPKLRVYEDCLTSELHGLAAEKLTLTPGAEHFDPKTDSKLRTLEIVKIKNSLAPGVVNRLQTELQALRVKITSGAKALRGEYLAATEARIDLLRAKLRADLLRTVGGDEDRAESAAEEVIRRSDLTEWADHWRSYSPPSDPLELVRALVTDVEAFDAGKAFHSF
jgi:hypothetical protein